VREYDADLAAVALTDDPEGLASALLAIERAQRGWLAWLFPGWGSPEPSWLRTHPATEERVRRLLELARRTPPARRDEGTPPAFPPPSSSAPRYRPGSGLWY
jgi:heat shock protein HtpX